MGFYRLTLIASRRRLLLRAVLGAVVLSIMVDGGFSRDFAAEVVGCTRRVSHMGAYGALGGGGRAGAREGRKDGTLQRLASARGDHNHRPKTLRISASAKFLAFVSLLQSFSPRCRAAGGHENKKEKSSTAQEGPRYDGCKAERQQKQSEAACKVICTAA